MNFKQRADELTTFERKRFVYKTLRDEIESSLLRADKEGYERACAEHLKVLERILYDIADCTNIDEVTMVITTSIEQMGGK